MDNLGTDNVKIVFKALIEVSESQADIWADGKVTWSEKFKMISDAYKGVEASKALKAAWNEMNELSGEEKADILEFIGDVAEKDKAEQIFKDVFNLADKMIEVNEAKDQLVSTLKNKK